METLRHVRLVPREKHRRFLADGDHRRIQRLDIQTPPRILVAHAVQHGVHGPIAARYHVKWRDLAACFVQQPVPRIGGQRLEAEPKCFRHTVRRLAKPGKVDLDHRLSVGQTQIEVHDLRPCDPARPLAFGILDGQPGNDPMTAGVRLPPGFREGWRPGAAARAEALDVGLAEILGRPVRVALQIRFEEAIIILFRERLVSERGE